MIIIAHHHAIMVTSLSTMRTDQRALTLPSGLMVLILLIMTSLSPMSIDQRARSLALLVNHDPFLWHVWNLQSNESTRYLKVFLKHAVFPAPDSWVDLLHLNNVAGTAASNNALQIIYLQYNLLQRPVLCVLPHCILSTQSIKYAFRH